MNLIFCFTGGNLATNAGGLRVIKYGNFNQFLKYQINNKIIFYIKNFR